MTFGCSSSGFAGVRRRCLYRGCNLFVERGSYCAAHKPYGKGWPATRALILARDNWQCRCDGCSSCAATGVGPCQRKATTVDHIDGRSDEPHNLRAMCRPCNTKKGGL